MHQAAPSQAGCVVKGEINCNIDVRQTTAP